MYRAFGKSNWVKNWIIKHLMNPFDLAMGRISRVNNKVYNIYIYMQKELIMETQISNNLEIIGNILAPIVVVLATIIKLKK